MLVAMLPEDKLKQWNAWMVETQAGDAVSYRKLLKEIQPLLTNFLRKRMPDELVDDTVQETLMALHRVRHTYDPKQPFHAWLFAIARHKHVDALRKSGRKLAREGISLSDVETFLSDETNAYEQSELRQDLSQALDALNEKQRTVVELLKLKGWSLAEVAEHTGQSVGAVKVTAHRAYKAMKKLLGKDGY
jgi:RNA polymerase sigma-70 factor (ECF subfamily)